MEDLTEKIRLHNEYLETYGVKGQRANLNEANLSRADMSRADMRWADLSEADMRWASLSKASLSEANLSEADLRWANLSGANLRGANLSEADLRGADMRGVKRFLTAGIDPRGFELKVWKEEDGFWVSSGCRTLPMEEALKHWGEGYSPSQRKEEVANINLGNRYVTTIKFLVNLLEVEGQDE
jgi:hypothetical protein